jgi:AraC-like DNA-binding protein
MDALSDLLRVLRFSGGVFLEARWEAPFCIDSQVEPQDCGPGVDTAGDLVAFHYMLAGRVEVRVREDETQTAGPGCVVLLPRNDTHRLGSDLRLPPMPAEPLIQKAGEHELARIEFGSGGTHTHFVCGYLATGTRRHPLLEALPELLVADMTGRPCAEWVETSFRYAAREHAARRPGSRDILARLSELLFVEAVREHIERLPGEATGWLAALKDPPLARALAALHARPERDWTTDALAEEAFLSRSALAERFVKTLGAPPMSYLTRWRMLLASRRLVESPDSIAQIAAAVGYESESTFSRAFSREMGEAPGAFRRSRATAPST